MPSLFIKILYGVSVAVFEIAGLHSQTKSCENAAKVSRENTMQTNNFMTSRNRLISSNLRDNVHAYKYFAKPSRF